MKKMNEDLKRKVEASIKRLQSFAPKEGKYYLAFSGGKDSVTIKALADMAGVKYDAHYRVTSVDPPDLVAFIRDFHPDVKRDIPRDKDGKPITMWSLIPQHRILPMRYARYCCQELKEDGGEGRKTITGVRWAESTNRSKNQGLITVPKKFKKGDTELEEALKEAGFNKSEKGGYILNNDNEEARRQVEHCYKWAKIVVNPIIDWTDRNVWDFIHEFNIPYCKLYDQGWTRIGCIGCPMGSTNQRIAEFRQYPKYEQAYKHAIEKLIKIMQSPSYRGHNANITVEEMWDWWLELEKPTGQIGFDEIDTSEMREK